MVMLRCRGVDSEEPQRSLFRILEGEEPAAVESLSRVARIADLLLRENALAGRFRPVGPGVLALELAAEQRTFFHNGICPKRARPTRAERGAQKKRASPSGEARPVIGREKTLGLTVRRKSAARRRRRHHPRSWAGLR